MIVITEINIYPVKSLAGIQLHQCKLELRGLENDRRWMVVDPEGKFITQRMYPQMALIRPSLDSGRLTLSKEGMEAHRVPETGAESERFDVQVWSDHVESLCTGSESDAWLSEAIGTSCRLVEFPDDQLRQCDQKYARESDQTAFADGFPLLLISEASLEDLNNRLDEPLPMRRFRPNLVVSGCEPYAEDRWKQIKVGDIHIRVVKPCSRCVMTTVDPATGTKEGSEPLRTLATYRAREGKVHFGQNLVQDNLGTISTGDQLLVIE